MITVILIGVSIFFIYRDLTKTEKEPWDLRIGSLTKAYGQAAILKSIHFIYKKNFHTLSISQRKPKQSSIRQQKSVLKVLFT